MIMIYCLYLLLMLGCIALGMPGVAAILYLVLVVFTILVIRWHFKHDPIMEKALDHIQDQKRSRL